MSAPSRSATAFAAAAATFVLAMVMLRRGIGLGPDAWTYWGASAALLEGRGYVDGVGLPVTEWPPLYSLWLAAVQAVTGVSAAGVRLADCLTTAGFAGALCHWLAWRSEPARAPRWPVAAFAVAGGLLALRGPGSEYLMLLGLFLSLNAIEGWRRATSVRARVLWSAAVVVLTAAMVETRHAALAFVPATCAVLLAAREVARPTRWVTAALVASSSFAVSLTVAAALGQQGRLTLFGSARTFAATAAAMAMGIDRVVAPFPLGIALAVAGASVFTLPRLRRRAASALRTDDRALRHADVVAFCGIALLGVLAMFLSVHVADEPDGRFVRFAGLMIAGSMVGAACRIGDARWRWALLALLLLPNAMHAAKVVALGRTVRNTVTDDGGESWLPLTATLSRDAAPGTVLPDGRVVVAVPLFRWQRERLERREKR